MKVTSSNEILGAIKMYMYMHDISQDDLAQMMGKSKQTISMAFKSKNPSTNTLFEIVNTLNIPLLIDLDSVNKPTSKKQKKE